MAGSGLRVKECSASIIQLERFNALRAVRDAKQSGICVNRFADKSSECKVLTSGAKLVAEIAVNELSAKLRCFKNLHLVLGNIPASKFEELPLGLVQLSDMLECELPDPDRFTLWDPLTCPCVEPGLELVGRTGELLLGLPLPC